MLKKAVFDPKLIFRLISVLKSMGYAKKTISAYVYWVRRYLESGMEFEQFIVYLVNKGKSISSVRTAGFAIKYFLKHVFGKKTSEIPNAKSKKKLPVILSKKEIENMIYSTNNLNHRIIIMMIYSTGMRLSEIRNLKWKDIDFQRKIIHIKNAKGGKDRIVMLSSKLKKGLRSINEKGEYVFMTNRLKRYNSRTIQKIISDSAKKAKINKKVTPHTLRHCFATHLLENGVDIRYIQDLLGHSDLKTTMIYTNVSKKDITKIKSPLDM